MWIQKDKSTKGISWEEISDWVVIDGVIWVEVSEKEVNEACIAQI
jgi:hypothetical protein